MVGYESLQANRILDIQGDSRGVWIGCGQLVALLQYIGGYCQVEGGGMGAYKNCKTLCVCKRLLITKTTVHPHANNNILYDVKVMMVTERDAGIVTRLHNLHRYT